MNTSSPGFAWARLLGIARELIDQVNAEQSVIEQWTLGGGTAMMIQIDHRESHDVDIFLDDPQLLPLIDPQKRDFRFDIAPSAQQGDGARFLKLSFDGIGEIDFIVAAAMTASPTTEVFIENQTVFLDTIPEVITKKVCYRGSSIRPRDIFDIAAAGEQHGVAVIEALRTHRAEVSRALTTMDRLNPEFVNGAVAQLSIKARYASLAKTSLEKAMRLLQAV